MLERNLLYLESFNSEFKGKKYKISRFVDVQTLQMFSGTNLKNELVKGNVYKCMLEPKSTKLTVASVE